MQRQSVAIVGAGLAGSLLAIYLSRRGFEVTIFERRSDARKSGHYGGRSINLALSTRGLTALAGVGLDQTALDLAVPMRGRLMHNLDATTTFQPYSARPDQYINSISRAGLNALLLDTAEEAGATVSFQQTCQGVNLETVAVTLRDETTGLTQTHHPDILIGADGASSNVRQSMVESGRADVRVQTLDHSYLELTMPPYDNGTHRMRREALHIWPRQSHMLIALPNNDGSFTCTLFLASNGTTSFNAFDAAPALERFFADSFPDAMAHLSKFQSEAASNPVSQLRTVWCDNWHIDSRILLIGDAAHAIVPFYGQGMNCAFEDCLILDRLLGHFSNDWSQAIPDFVRHRKSDTDAIADLALANFVEMRDKVADPRFLLQKQFESEIARRYPNQYTPIYSLITFSNIRYAEAQRRAHVQAALLQTWMAEATHLDDVDWGPVEEWMQT